MTPMKLLRCLNKNCIYLSLLLSVSSFSQSSESYLEYKKTYDNINELIINDNISYEIFIEKNKIKVLQNNYYESMIMSENGIHNNKENFSYSELIKLNDFEAYSVINSKGRERKMKVTQITERQANQSSIFYNGVKEKQLTFPNLEAGVKKVYSYQREFIDPFLLQSHIFGSNYPVLNSTLEIKVDEGITIGYRIFNDPDNNIEFSKTEKKGQHIYRWTLKNIKPVKMESNNPGFRYFIPHINVYVKDYTINNNKINVLDDTGNLYEYYKSFIKDLNITEDAGLKAFTLELTSGITSDTEKMKQIFYWVKDNIKYIAFENGYEGFIPRQASLVYNRKFGDCKDMSSIICAMAKYAEIDNVSVAWIGTRDIPYSYNQLSTPAVDNHMIAVFIDNDNDIFLDATDRETRYGLPTAFIQGKEALISDRDTYKVIKVPVIEPKQNETKEIVKISIDKGKIIGSGTVSHNGFSRTNLLSQIGDATDKRRFEMIKSIVNKGSNKFQLKKYTEHNISDRDLPYEINYDFELDNYTIQVDRELYIGLFLDHFYEGMSLDADRVTPISLDYLQGNHSVYELKIPEKYSVKHLPEDFTIDNDLVKAECYYVNTKDTVSLTVKIELKKLLIEQPDFALWNQTIKSLKNTYSQTLILIENEI